MTEANDKYKYDAFISYSHHDKDWVQGWLLPRLKQAGLRICVDFRDFEPGLPSLVNMENAVERSRRTLIVLTPEWMASEWATFESLLIQTDDPAGRQRRMIPLLLKPCTPPKRIAMLTYLDFTQASEMESQIARLVAAVKTTPEVPAPARAGRLAVPTPPTLEATNAAPSDKAVRYDSAAIRDLLIAAFDDEGLTTFCFDHFREVYEGFAIGMSKPMKVQRLLEYAERRNQLYELLVRVKSANPAKYAEYEDRLMEQRESVPAPVPLPIEKRPESPSVVRQRGDLREAVSEIPVVKEPEVQIKERWCVVWWSSLSNGTKTAYIRLFGVVLSALIGLVGVLAAPIITEWAKSTLSTSTSVPTAAPSQRIIVAFRITYSDGPTSTIKALGIITVATNQIILLRPQLSTTPWPENIFCLWNARAQSRGRVSPTDNCTTSYQAPGDAGPDFITVAILKGGEQIDWSYMHVQVEPP